MKSPGNSSAHGTGGNVDHVVVAGFADEWKRFDQRALSPADRARIFDDYFSQFPWSRLTAGAVGADIGCGSGRWALLAAPRVGLLHCVDPGDAIEVARRGLAGQSNIRFHRVDVGNLPFADESLDFAYSLGVLHHVPDTAAALRQIARKLKPGAPFLVYLYYAFDNRPMWFRWIWRTSELLRRAISSLPYRIRYVASQLIAAAVYWPLARSARLVESLGGRLANWPLAYYRDKAFYVMRTDALDRFGTRLEKRFSRAQIQEMMEDAGFHDIRFADHVPYWCAVGIRN
jgi:ubiquinone/menaquinone biosynthesis C-methylase UbiE